jgi:hypothetical protein
MLVYGGAEMALRTLEEAGRRNVDPKLMQDCLAEYTRLDIEMKRLAQETAAMFGRYEGQGVNKKSIKATYKASNMESREAVLAQQKSDMHYMVACGVVTVADDAWVRSLYQGDMFSAEEVMPEDAPVSRKLSDARAYNDGYNTGRHGGDEANNKLDPGSSERVQWSKGLKDGLVDRDMRGKTKPKKADTTVKKAKAKGGAPATQEPAEVD